MICKLCNQPITEGESVVYEGYEVHKECNDDEFRFHQLLEGINNRYETVLTHLASGPVPNTANDGSSPASVDIPDTSQDGDLS